ncbi:MAG: hypothetical protein ACD_59C00030G0002 [uncultured bacterium]|nr:MAG: hypothetical protein ACD_59C00030G0002 [uncultured bacterium]
MPKIRLLNEDWTTRESVTTISQVKEDYADLDELLEDDSLENTKQQFVMLRAAGCPYSKISEQLDISKTTLVKWGKQMKPAINDLKTIELEELREQFFASQRARIQTLGSQLAAVNTELATRDLKEVPTLRLFDIMIKLTETLKTEFKIEGTD